MTVEMPKRRAWFQLHLSTCVVLMVVAGALMWANLAGMRKDGTVILDCEHYGKSVLLRFEVGWPESYCSFVSKLGPGEVVVGESRIGYISEVEEELSGFTKLRHDSQAVRNNVILCLGILALTAVACELLIRRRARKRQDPVP